MTVHDLAMKRQALLGENSRHRGLAVISILAKIKPRPTL